MTAESNSVSNSGGPSDGPSLTRRQAVLLVVRRELIERTRQRSFAVSTGVTLLIVLAIAIVPGLGGDDGPEKYDIGVVARRPVTPWPTPCPGSTWATGSRSPPGR